MKTVIVILMLLFSPAVYAQEKSTVCYYQSFTFGYIPLDSNGKREYLTITGDCISVNSEKYSLVSFKNLMMKMELVGTGFPIDSEDTLFYDRRRKILYLFKHNKGYKMEPWIVKHIDWRSDTATYSSEGKTAYLKKKLPADVFPMPRVDMGVGVYRYASKMFFLQLLKYEIAYFDFRDMLARIKHIPVVDEELKSVY